MALNWWKECDLFPSMSVSRRWSVGVCGKSCRLCCSQQRDTSTVGQRLFIQHRREAVCHTSPPKNAAAVFENSASVDHPALGQSLCRKNIKSRMRGESLPYNFTSGPIFLSLMETSTLLVFAVAVHVAVYMKPYFFYNLLFCSTWFSTSAQQSISLVVTWSCWRGHLLVWTPVPPHCSRQYNLIWKCWDKPTMHDHLVILQAF